MNTTELLSGPLAQAIGLALLHALWQGTIVAAVLAAALALLQRRTASLRYAVSCAALALVFTLAVFTAVRSYPPRTEVSAAGPSTVVAASPLPEDSVVISATAAPRSWEDVATGAIAPLRRLLPEIVMLWLAGVLILTLRLAGSWTRTRALATRGAVAADEAWQLVATRLSAALGLRGAVRLVVCGGVDVPSVVGWMKPAILLPVSSFTGLTGEQLEMVLAHELAHIRRHDFLVNALQSVVETLLFYHPAVWWVSKQIRVERENCCDDLAVSVCGDAVRYARALAQLEELRSAPLLAVAANGGSLLDRVRRLVGAHTDRSLFSSSWTAASAIVSFIAIVALTTAPMFAARKKAPPAAPAATKVEVRAPKAAKAPPAPPAPRATASDEDVEERINEVDTDDDTFEPFPAIPAPPVEFLDMPAPAAPAAPIAPMPAVSMSALAAPVAIAAGTLESIEESVSEAVDDEDDEQTSPTPPGKLSIDELIGLRVQGVTPEYIQAMRSAGLGELSLRDITTFRIHGVTVDYIQKIRAANLGTLTARDIASLRVQGVTPEYIAEMRTAGVPIKTAREAVSLRVQGVNPGFVRQLAAAGYEKLTVRDLVRLAATGVNADFIREMSKYKK